MQTKAVLRLLIFMAGALAAATAGGQAAQPAYEISTRKPEDKVTATVIGQAVIFAVTSPSGIGAATITPKAGTWPKTAAIRLHLRGLESLAVSAGAVTLNASVASHGEHAKRLYLRGADKEKPIEPGSPYWTELKVANAEGKPVAGLPPKDGYFELTLPAALLRERPAALKLSWIDFYR